MVLRLFLCMLVETLKLLVMYSSMLCEFDCKFWERRDNFSSLDSPYNFVFKSKLKLTIKNNVPKPEQYSEFFNQVTTINLLSLSQSFGWSLTQWREGYLLPTWAWITLTTFQLNAPVIMPWWQDIFRLVTDDLLFIYAATNWEVTENAVTLINLFSQ